MNNQNDKGKQHADSKVLKNLLPNQEIQIDNHCGGKTFDFQDKSQDIHIHKKKIRKNKGKEECIHFRIPLQRNYGEIDDNEKNNSLYQEVKQVLDNKEDFEEFAKELKDILKHDLMANGRQARQVINRLRKYFGLSFKGTTTVKKTVGNKLSMYAMRLPDEINDSQFYYFIITKDFIKIGDDSMNYFSEHIEGNRDLSSYRLE